MPYVRLQQQWHITVKDPHTLLLDVREGIFRDKLQLFVDSILATEAIASVWRPKGYRLIDVDGRTLELRWIWDRLGGNPISIILMHKERILAQYGSDAAAQFEIEDE
jgi:hypothetical protein